MLDALFEIIFDVILEGSFEAATNKKVPLVIRILCVILWLAVFGGFISLFVYLGVKAFLETHIVFGIVFTLIGILFVFLLKYVLYDKIKKAHSKPEEESAQPESITQELWDAYTVDGKPTGEKIIRGEDIPQGLYHIVCEILIMHTDGSILCMKRASTKPNYPGFCEATAGGSALAGEDKWQCVKRELREETGLSCNNINEIGCNINEAEHGIFYSFVGTVDCEKDSVRLQQGETEDYKWLDEAEFIDFINSDRIIDVQKKRFLPYYEKMGYIKSGAQ